MDARSLAALATTIFFWSSAFIGIRVGLQGYSPGSLALLRYLTAAIAVIPVYFSLKNRTKVCPQDWFLFFLAGASGFTVYNIALNHGEVTVPAGIASFIVGLIPVFTTLLAIVFLKERMRAGAVLGIVISFIGIVFIAIGEHGGVRFDMGVVYSLIAALSASIYAIVQKLLLKRYQPLQVGAIAIWIGTLLLLFYTPTLYREVQIAPLPASISGIYMGIFPGVIAYSAWSYALSRIPASQASTAIYTMPIVTTVMGYLSLGEVPAIYSLIGGVIALCGAVVVHQHYYSKPQTQTA